MINKGKFISVFLLSIVFIGIVTAAQTLEVSTNTANYNPEDLVEISGSLKDNGNPYPNQQIGIQVLKPNQELYFLDQTTTDSLGNFYSQVQLADSLVDGVYTVYASSSTIQSNTTFEIKTVSCTESWNCGIWSICTGSYQYRTCTDSNHCGTETYKPLEAMPCSVTTSTSSGGGGATASNPNETPNETTTTNDTQNSMNTTYTAENQNETTTQLNETDNNQTVQTNKTPITGMILATQATPYLLGIFLMLSGVFTYLQIKKNPNLRSKKEKKLKVGSLRAVSGIFMLFLLLLIPSVSGYSIETSRIIPSNLNPSDEFQISINVNFDESNLPPSAILSEKIPDGFEVIDLGSGFLDDSRNTIKWLFLPVQPYLAIEDIALNYTLKAPDSAQTAALNGVVNVGSEALPVCGDELLTIGCIEQWNCSEWTSCSNNLQTRTCEDQNSCGTEANKPAISRACNLAIDEPEEETDNSETNQGTQQQTETAPSGNSGTTEQIQESSNNQTTSGSNQTTELNETENSEDAQENIIQTSDESNLTLNQTDGNLQGNKTSFTGNITVTSMTLNSLLLLLSIITGVLIFFNLKKNNKPRINQNLWN